MRRKPSCRVENYGAGVLKPGFEERGSGGVQEHAVEVRGGGRMLALWFGHGLDGAPSSV